MQSEAGAHRFARLPALLDNPIRRDVCRLAHAQGTLLNITLVGAAICARLEMILLSRFSSLNLKIAVLTLIFTEAAFIVSTLTGVQARHLRRHPKEHSLQFPRGREVERG
jgi:hypothetical protein